MDPLVREAEPREGPRAEVLDDDIGLLDEPLEDLRAIGMLEVDRDAALVPVDREVVGGHAIHVGRRPGPRLVADARQLHLDHVGAVVREHEGAIGTGERSGEVHHADPGERTVRRPATDRGQCLEGVVVAEDRVTVALLAVHDERRGLGRRDAQIPHDVQRGLPRALDAQLLHAAGAELAELAVEHERDHGAISSVRSTIALAAASSRSRTSRTVSRNSAHDAFPCASSSPPSNPNAARCAFVQAGPAVAWRIA